MMEDTTPSSSSGAAIAGGNDYTYRQCHLYNVSWNGTNSVERNTLLQKAYFVNVESPIGVSYRVLFALLYYGVVLWCSHQYVLHGRRKKLWWDNRQIVVQSLLWCSLMRGSQFLVKVATDCNAHLKMYDELLTALETVLQFLAFVLLIAFWVELKISMRRGLQNLQKTRTPVIAFSVVFALARMVECLFIILLDSPDSTIPRSTASLLGSFATGLRLFSILIYAIIMAVAGYWGFQLLNSLLQMERKSRLSQSSNPQIFSSSRSSPSLGQRSELASSSLSQSHMEGGHVDKMTSSLKHTTSQVMKHLHRASTFIGHHKKEESPKARLFRKKVMQMTLFMILEIVTVVVWIIFYAILYTMRGTSRQESGKIVDPRTYLILKYVEKLCEWLTIMVLCVTMIAGAQTKTAKDNAARRTGGFRGKPSRHRRKHPDSHGQQRRHAASTESLSSAGESKHHTDTASSLGVQIGLNVNEEPVDTRKRDSSFADASSFDVFGGKKQALQKPGSVENIMRTASLLSSPRRILSKKGRKKNSQKKKDQNPKDARASFPPDAEVMFNPTMPSR